MAQASPLAHRGVLRDLPVGRRSWQPQRNRVLKPAPRRCCCHRPLPANRSTAQRAVLRALSGLPPALRTSNPQPPSRIRDCSRRQRIARLSRCQVGSHQRPPNDRSPASGTDRGCRSSHRPAFPASHPQIPTLPDRWSGEQQDAEPSASRQGWELHCKSHAGPAEDGHAPIPECVGRTGLLQYGRARHKENLGRGG